MAAPDVGAALADRHDRFRAARAIRSVGREANEAGAQFGQRCPVTVSYKGSKLFERDVRLKIKRAGLIKLSGSLIETGTGEPVAAAPTGLTVIDLDGDGEVEVVVDLYSGGAHCCTLSRIYRFSAASGEYLSVEHEWGNYAYELVDLDGDGFPEFKSADNRFAYAFTAYVFSIPPLQIWRYPAGVMTEATDESRKLIRQDARWWWRVYVRERHQPARTGDDLRGMLAAWQANKVRLGEAADGWSKLRKARKRGELRGPGPWPAGRRYLKELRVFLANAGYA